MKLKTKTRKIKKEKYSTLIFIVLEN